MAKKYLKINSGIPEILKKYDLESGLYLVINSRCRRFVDKDGTIINCDEVDKKRLDYCEKGKTVYLSRNQQVILMLEPKEYWLVEEQKNSIEIYGNLLELYAKDLDGSIHLAEHRVNLLSVKKTDTEDCKLESAFVNIFDECGIKSKYNQSQFVRDLSSVIKEIPISENFNEQFRNYSLAAINSKMHNLPLGITNMFPALCLNECDCAELAAFYNVYPNILAESPSEDCANIIDLVLSCSFPYEILDVILTKSKFIKRDSASYNAAYRYKEVANFVERYKSRIFINQAARLSIQTLSNQSFIDYKWLYKFIDTLNVTVADKYSEVAEHILKLCIGLPGETVAWFVNTAINLGITEVDQSNLRCIKNAWLKETYTSKADAIISVLDKDPIIFLDLLKDCGIYHK